MKSWSAADAATSASGLDADSPAAGLGLARKALLSPSWQA